MIKIEQLQIPSTVYLEKYDIKVRPYLTLDEIISFGDTMKYADDIITREMSLMLNILDACTDIPKENLHILTDEEIENEQEDKFIGFDLLVQSGLWDAVKNTIINYDGVWEYVESLEDANKSIANFFGQTLPEAVDKVVEILENFEKKMPKGKQWNEILKTLPSELSNVLNVMKDDGNAKIIQNAMEMNKRG